MYHVTYTARQLVVHFSKQIFYRCLEVMMPVSWRRPPLRTLTVRYPLPLASALIDYAQQDGITLTRLLVELAAAEMERRGRIEIKGPADYALVAGPFPNN
jgi:hypothetical protein